MYEYFLLGIIIPCFLKPYSKIGERLIRHLNELSQHPCCEYYLDHAGLLLPAVGGNPCIPSKTIK